MDNKELPSYLEFIVERPDYSFESFTEGAGSGFLLGTLGGSFCHFFKGLARAKSFGGGINAMRANSLRTGGFFACFNLAVDIPSYVLYRYRGEKDIWTDEAISVATGAAIMWAPRGPRSASLAALTFGGIYALNQAFKVSLKNVKPKPKPKIGTKQDHCLPIQVMINIRDSWSSRNGSRG